MYFFIHSTSLLIFVYKVFPTIKEYIKIYQFYLARQPFNEIVLFCQL